jgi:glutamate dehydrogenase/leucine dehydrogenase
MAPLESALAQLDAIQRLALFDAEAITVLREPRRSAAFAIPLRMDTGRLRMVRAWRVLHNDARGPGLGGLRIHADADLASTSARAMWASVACAAADVPFGGARGAIAADPKELSVGELERLVRGYARAAASLVGPHTDIVAADMGADASAVAWVLDELAQCGGSQHAAGVVGKPLALGGSRGREAAAGLGGVIALEEAARRLNLAPRDTTVIIQGFGAVGYHFARHAHRRGFRIVGLADTSGAMWKRDGFDPEAVIRYKASAGSLAGYPGAEPVAMDFLLTADAQVLVLAATDSQVTLANADRVTARAVIELADGPVTAEADPVLARKGALVVPDVLAGAGSAIAGAFEVAQARQGASWTEDDLNDRLRAQMAAAFADAAAAQEKYGVTLRQAAYVVAVGRLAEAMRLRGWCGRG